MRTLVLLAALGAACSGRVGNQQPVLGGASTALAKERFLRRLYLDLSGAGPTPAQLEADLAALAADESARARAAIADRLLAEPAFGATFVAELENRALAGETLRDRYNLVCAVFRNFDPPCQACPQPTDGNLCHACECASVKAFADEQAGLRRAAGDLAGGAATSAIERRYAGSQMYRYSFGTPEALADALFRAFLGRTPSADETRNAAMLYEPYSQQPRALLFQRHGASYADLIDIVFGSEPYREAMVDGAFQRYLGRRATPDELRHFAAALDAGGPDLRPVVRAVVSSREYFAQ